MKGPPRLPLEPGQRTGLFGGSFDPAHDGHRHLADLALRRLELDRVVWLVSPGNPLKDEASHGLAERMAGARRVADPRTMPVSDIERDLGVSFTVDLLRRLVAIHPDVDFVWLMGSDNLESFPRWRGWREIAALVPIGVVARPGSQDAAETSEFARTYADRRLPLDRAAELAGAQPPAWVFIPGPLHPASSTAIRAGGIQPDDPEPKAC